MNKVQALEKRLTAMEEAFSQFVIASCQAIGAIDQVIKDKVLTATEPVMETTTDGE